MDTEPRSVTKLQKRTNSCCLADLPIENIIVYLERAEVTRSVKNEIVEGQVLECTFEQLPSTIEKDSIRIEVPSSVVSIQDVSFNVRPINEASEPYEKLKQIKDLIRKEKQNHESLQAKKSRILKQKHVLDVFANTLVDRNSSATNICSNESVKNVGEKGVSTIKDAYNPNNLETIENFFKLYNDNGQRFDEDLFTIDEKLEQSINKIECLESDIKLIELRQDELLYRELLVVVEGRADSDFEMHISYVVNDCSWRPVYDIRVSNNAGTMQINYYGAVSQRSGEDWYSPKTFSLSTSEPSIGGTVPEVTVQRVQFKNPSSAPKEEFLPPPTSPTPSTPNAKKSTSRLSSFKKSRTPSINIFDFNQINDTLSSNHVLTPVCNQAGRPLLNKSYPSRRPRIKSNVLGTLFDIARPPPLVTCNNIEYRVMVAVINLEPHYQHVTVPKYSPYAFLRSFATNSSKYTLLEGPANIYIDSNFVGKTPIVTICPCEEFYCNLGVDKGIRISYKPMFKYRENNQKSVCVTFKQEIHVHNAHERPIKLVVVDQLPVSADEKIKVTLIEPCIKNLEKYDRQKPIRINSNRQIEWDCEIGSNDKKEMVLKFTVEHPYGRDIEVMQLN